MRAVLILVFDLKAFLVRSNSELLIAIAIPDVSGETAISVNVLLPKELHVFPESAEYIKFPVCESAPYRSLPAPSKKWKSTFPTKETSFQVAPPSFSLPVLEMQVLLSRCR